MVPEVTIMNARKFKGQKILAMAVVAMFAFCAFSVCLTDNGSDAAPYTGTYQINVVEGGKFSYSPTFNTTTGTITIAQTGDAALLPTETTTPAAVPNVEYTRTFGASDIDRTSATGKELTAILTATWTPEGVSAGSDLIQTAKQTITFNVYEKVGLPSTDEINKNLTGQFTGPTIVSIPVTAPINSTVTATSETPGMIKVTPVEESNGDTTSITVSKGDSFAAPSETTTVDVTVSVQDNVNDTNRIQMTYQFVIYPNLKISCTPTEINTYVGKDSTPSELQFSVDGLGATSVAPVWSGDLAIVSGASTSELPAGVDLGMNPSSGKYTVDLTKITNENLFPESGSDLVKLSVKPTVTFTRDGVANSETIEGGLTYINIYKKFEFTKDPEIDGNVTYTTSGNPLDVIMSADFEGTTKITYNWGDGKSTTVNTNPDAGSKYSARHVYASEGSYVITVTAYNSVGSTTVYTLYDAKTSSFAGIDGETGETEGEDPTVPEKTFFEEHGYQFIVFALIAVLGFVAFFFFGYQNPLVLIVAIITALLAVLCFVYNDIGGLIDEIKAILKL